MPATAVFPRPRPGRTPTIPTVTGGGGLAIPRVRLWPWVLNNGAQTRQTIVSQRMTGPAYIESFYYGAPIWPSTTAGIGNLALIVSDDSSGQGDDTGNTAPSGLTIWDRVSDAINQARIAGDVGGIPEFLPASFNAPERIHIGVPVSKTNFFLKVTLRNTSAGTTQIFGWVRILESLTEEQLANLLSAG